MLNYQLSYNVLDYNHIISENAKNLITKILVLDPTKRPTLDEIFAHPFINNGIGIPKTLPHGTLACPPPSYFVKFQSLIYLDNFKFKQFKGKMEMKMKFKRTENLKSFLK